MPIISNIRRGPAPAFVIGLGLLAVVWAVPLVDWVRLALSENLHSHVLLIPVVSGFLAYTGRRAAEEVAVDGAPRLGGGLLALATLGLVASWVLRPEWPVVDLVALRVALFVVAVWGLALACHGVGRVKRVLFPLLFLIFMIPMPGWMEVSAEKGLMAASAVVSEWFFEVGGIPVWRQGQILRIPGLSLEVAQECSGIRSSYVLLITSVLVAHLYLSGPVRRGLLVLAVVPLGILRNAFRIYVIGALCVHHGSDMIDHWIHRKGGPLFFAISLLPLLLLVWVLHRTGSRGGRRSATPALPSAQGASSR